MSTTADDLGVLGNLAEAIGLTNDGAFEPGWLSDPGEHLGAMLANERQRDALVAFIDEVLGGADRSTGPDGSTWLPIAQASAPQVTVFVVVDDRDADSVAIGLGVRVASTAPPIRLRSGSAFASRRRRRRRRSPRTCRSFVPPRKATASRRRS